MTSEKDEEAEEAENADKYEQNEQQKMLTTFLPKNDPKKTTRTQ